MAKHRETRWVVMKDYYKDDTNFTDIFLILYGTKEEAEVQKAQLETGYDKSFFDPEGNEYAGYEAFMYVDQISL
jgi:hypothetical protein